MLIKTLSQKPIQETTKDNLTLADLVSTFKIENPLPPEGNIALSTFIIWCENQGIY